MSNMKIAKLDPTDVGYSNGCRWVVVAPAWIGPRVAMVGLKKMTLEDAVTTASRSETELATSFRQLATEHIVLESEAQSISSMEDTLKIVRANKARGRKGRKGFKYSDYLNTEEGK